MTETARLVIAVDSRQVGQGETDLARLGKTSSAVEREVKSLTGALAGLAAPLAAAFSVKSIYDSAEAYSTLTNRLRLVTDGAVALAAAQQSVFTIAQNARQPLEATAELYQRIATNQTALKLSGQGVADIVSTISKTLAISGASAESSKAALVQLGQAFASGTLRGEELNSVMEQAPALSQAIAAGMGKTVGQLRSLGAEGKLTAEEVVKALQKQAGAVDALFGKMTATVGGGLTTIGNSFTNYVGQIDQATGASGNLANEILSVSKAIDGSLPGTLSTLKENASALVQVLETGLYVAAGRVASVFVQQAGAAGVAAVANQALLKSEAESARQALTTAQARQAESKSLVERAALEVKAAESRVASDRAVQVSQIAGLQTVQASLAAELSLEQQRLKAQITDQGRAASVARMAEVRLAEIAIIKQVEIAERGLAATTIATSAQAEAAYAGRTAAVLAFGETTTAVNALSAASTKATAAASLTGQALTGLRSAGAGLLGIMGGPVGLAVIAGAVALSFVDFGSKSKALMGDLGDLGKSVDQVRTEFNKLNADQQKAQVNAWKDKQLGAALAVEEAYKGLKSTIESALIETPNADVVDLSKVAEQARAYDAVIEKLDAAKASGQALGPVLREAAASGQISPAQLKGWESQAGVISDNISVVNQINERLGVQTSILDQNTSSTQANNVAKAGFTDAGEKYLGTLQKQLGKLQDNNDAVKEASRYLEEHKDLSEADRAAILSTGYAIKAQDDANKAALKSTRDSNSEAKKHATEVENLAKKLREFSAESALAAKSATDMATAYLNGADSVRDLSIEQKAQEQVLKTGADSYDMVKAALIGLRDAEDSRNIAQSIANMRVEVTQTLAQATATLQGKTALEAFNIQKSMSIALSGKNIEYGSQEYELLLQQTKAQLEANKALEQAGQVEGIVDRLNPQIKLLKDFTTEQEALNAAIARYPENAALYQDALVKLGNEYQVNQSKATIWGQLTEGAVDRIDGVFADAWANIGSGADNLWDSLVKGAKQAFGEIAHMLTTKPLLASISNWLTGTDNGQGLSSVWGKLLGSAGGSSSGGGSMFSGLAGIGQNLLSAWNTITGVGSSVASGYASGGISGAISGGAGYYGNMLNGIATTLSSGFTSLIGGNIAITGATAAGTAATTAALTGISAEVALGSAASVGAEGITAGLLQGAIAEGAASVGSSIGVAGATTAAASSGMTAALSGALSSAVAMWPLAIVMGMYQSGKLYDAGVRPSMSEMQATGGDTALGKATMAPIALQSGIMELTDKINSKIVGGKLAAILSGSTLHQAVWGAVGKKLFGGGYENKDSGIQLDVTDGVFDAGGFVKQKKKGGLISGSSKTRYLQTDLAPELEDSLGAAYNDKVLSSMGLFSALGVTLSETVLDGLTMGVTRISTEGRTQEEIQTDLDAWFTSLGNSAVAAISDATNSGVANYTFDELTAFTNNLYSINDMFKLLNINALPVSVWGGKLTEQYVAMAGGMEALQSAATSYYNAFFSETERADDTLAAIQAQFKSLNLTLPDTAPGFRAMVEGIDSTTDSGRAMYIQLMGLSSSAASAYSILESRAKEAEAASEAASQAALDAAQAVKDALLGVVRNASSGVSRAVEAERDTATKAYNARVASLNDMSATAAQSVTDLSTVSNSLESALKSLNGTSDDAVKTLRAQAQATLQSALATARAGGSLAGFAGLEDALDKVSDNNTDLYSSMEDFARDQGRTANVVAELNAINGKQLSAAEKLQESLESQIDLAKEAYDAQMAQFDAQLDFAQAQMDALNGVDNSVLSVVDAVNAMNAAVVAALATVKSATPTNSGTLIDSVYNNVLGRDADKDGKQYWQGQVSSGAVGYDQLAGAIKNAATENAIKNAYSSVLNQTADAAGAAYWAGQVSSGALSVSQLEQAIKNAAVANGSIPAYATGGDHMGGLRLVGENGPELEVTGPSRIFNANQTAAILKGGGGSNSNLEQKVDVLIDVVKQIVGPMKLNSDADSKLFKKWDRVGLPTIAVGA